MVILTFLQCLVRITDLWIIIRIIKLNAAVKGRLPFFPSWERGLSGVRRNNRTFTSLQAVFPLWHFQFKYPF